MIVVQKARLILLCVILELLATSPGDSLSTESRNATEGFRSTGRSRDTTQAAATERLFQRRHRRYRETAKIYFAAESYAILYVNGRFRKSVRGYGRVAHDRLALKYGDVVSIRAESLGSARFGVIASIRFRHKRFSTGGPGWKATRFGITSQAKVHRWLGRGYRTCHWPRPVLRSNVHAYRSSSFRRFLSSARYVWARNAGPKSSILLRFVVGGERCPPRLAKITFAADNVAWLYVNGRLRKTVNHFNHVSIASLNLRPRDVVAIKAADYGYWYGVIADIQINGRHMVTGGPGWKAMRGHRHNHLNPVGWTTQRYSSCHWAPPSLRPLTNQAGKARSFPYLHGAKYVWARGAGVRDVVLLRYVVGGERCSRPTYPLTKISISADNRAWLFINGRFVKYIANWRYASTLKWKLNVGDVIAIKAQDTGGGYGVIADILMQEQRIVTGLKGWKARRGNIHDRSNPRGWNTRRYRSCGWPSARTIPFASPSVPNKARNFPYQHGARYVWAQGVAGYSTILLRYVVGGENCNRTPLPKPNARIVYAANRRHTVSVNGRPVVRRRIGSHVYIVRTSLQKGDVVSFWVGYSGWKSHGLLADIYFRGRHFQTGRVGWKAVGHRRAGRHWRLKKFNSCSWPAAIGRGGWTRKRGFPVSARYIWGRGVRPGSSIAVRFIVGGERCGIPASTKPSVSPSPSPKASSSPSASATASVSPSPKPSKVHGTITMAADNGATVFVNGKEVGAVRSWRELLRVDVSLGHGDVVAVAAHDSGPWFGVNVIVQVGKDVFATGKPGWKAKARLSPRERAGGRWLSRSLTSCKWQAPVSRPNANKRFGSVAPAFPRALRSEYVWARDAKIGDTAFLRFVVGGESC